MPTIDSQPNRGTAVDAPTTLGGFLPTPDAPALPPVVWLDGQLALILVHHQQVYTVAVWRSGRLETHDISTSATESLPDTAADYRAQALGEMHDHLVDLGGLVHANAEETQRVRTFFITAYHNAWLTRRGLNDVLDRFRLAAYRPARTVHCTVTATFDIDEDTDVDDDAFDDVEVTFDHPDVDLDCTRHMNVSCDVVENS